VLVAVLGTSTRNAADFHSAWLITVAGAVATGLVLAAIGRPVRAAAPGPVLAESAASASA
jgi:hypothetical protein